MTAVASSAGGYVAAGYLGSLVGPIEARFWRSADGRDWTLADEGADLAASRVSAIAARPDGGFVAVGTTGDAKVADGSTAWTSTDGSRWTRTTTDALRAGLMRAVTAADDGLLAVGNDLASTRAMVFRSNDGLDLGRRPGCGEPRQLRAQDRDARRRLGWRSASSRAATGSSGRSSRPGCSGCRATGRRGSAPTSRRPSARGGFSGVAAGGPGFVAVGTYGSPDFAIPTVWLSPP